MGSSALRRFAERDGHLEPNTPARAERFLESRVLTSSARVSAAAASPAQERLSGALAEATPLHLGGGEAFGTGS